MADVELRQVGLYTISGLLKEGSTGSLYQGKQQQRKKDVVIKIIRAPLATTEAREAFVARAKQLKKLTHRHIIGIQDFGLIQDGGAHHGCGYLVMPYVPGGTLREHFTPGQRVEPVAVKTVLSAIGDALNYAHVNTIVHANLHPANLFGTPSNPLLANFALAVPGSPLAPDNDAEALLYGAPEYLRGVPIPASDQYALAAMVYEWLCGRRPYEASEPSALLRQQEQEPLPPPSSFNDAISPAVEQVLLQALARVPEERFAHTQAFSYAYLRALMGLPVEIAPRAVPNISMPMPATLTAFPATGPLVEAREIAAPVRAATPIPTHSLPQQEQRPLVAVPPLETKSVPTLTTPQPIVLATPPTTSAPASEKKLITITPIRKPAVPSTPALPLAGGESWLRETMTSDLGQGGVLSETLPGYEERSAQIEMAMLVARALTEDTPAIIEAATGTGKALDVDTPIPTPTGWKRMGDLVVGDTVFDERGHPTRVTAAFAVMHHRPCYEVAFSDGSSLIADAEHEWASYTSVDRAWAKQPKTSTYKAKHFVTSGQLTTLDRLIALSQNDEALSVTETVDLIEGHRWSIYQAAREIPATNLNMRPVRYSRQALLTAVRTRLAKDLDGQRRDCRAYTLVTTEKMAATLTVGSSPRANHAIAVASPLVLPDVELPIAPYFLGVWLGDGSCRNNQITTADVDLITEIEKDGYTVRSLKSHPYLYAVDDENGKAMSRWQPGMTGRLRELELRLNKHIPTIYLRASVQQRRALLAGLLDTDGTVSHTGAVEFTTTSPRLAQDVYELVCSLGFRPTLRCGRARLKEKDCGPKWTLSFTTAELVFRLPRKVQAQQERLRNYSPERNRFRYVVAVREVPSRPVRCIQVDSLEHLYLAGRSMIPTHNSLAYLVPIVRSGKVAIVSTANKALQEQLFYKDIPFVQQHIKPFEAALVKGMANYICLDRLEGERVGLQFYAKNREFQRLLELTQDTNSDFMGDFETLPFPLPLDIKSRIFADGDQCAWGKCGYFLDCYVRKMRIQAEQAQVIVVNHTLLLLDAAMEGHLLPERDMIVLDEAHHLEEEATRAFTVTFSPGRISTLLAQRMLKDHSLIALQDDAVRASTNLWQRLDEVANPGASGRVNLREPVEEGLRLATIVSDLADSLRKQRPKDMPEKETSLYDKLLKRTQNLAEDIRTIFSVSQPEKFVYYVERVFTPGQRGGQVHSQVSAAPLDITTWLQERLFDKYNVICTSATLATTGPNPAKPEEKGPNFAYFRRRVGLDPLARPNVLERILPLTFDYESNALLYLPRNLPEPAYGKGEHVDAYTKALAREMYHLVRASRGRAFLLFSSKRMLDSAYDLMAPHLDFLLLRQGDMPRIEITRKFKEESAVLFGLKSFWEGVDIPGEALSLVVIDKLPFDPPDDPVHEARVAQMKAAGENWFGTYVLPQAVLRLKQGLGRLLRTRDDRGVMALLDARLHTKGYGKQILNALPPARRTSSIKDVERFFAEEQEETPF